MNNKVLVGTFIFAGMSPVCAMSPEGGERSDKYALLRMVPEADGQDCAVRENPFIAGSSQSANELKNLPSNKQAPVENSIREEAKKMLQEALKAVGVEDPLAVSATCIDKCGWLIKLHADDKELFKYVAYQTAVQWQIANGVEEYIPSGVKGYRYIVGISGVVSAAFMSGALAEAASGDVGPVPMINSGVAVVAAGVGSYTFRKRYRDNYEKEVLNLDLHTAQALCANNHRDAVTRMIADIDKEDSDNPVSQWWLIRIFSTWKSYDHNVRLERKALLQEVLNEQSSVII